jgi:hypothetical protein
VHHLVFVAHLGQASATKGKLNARESVRKQGNRAETLRNGDVERQPEITAEDLSFGAGWCWPDKTGQMPSALPFIAYASR